MEEMTDAKRQEIRKKNYLPTAYHYYEKPLFLKKAKNQYVWDQKDHRYLDAIGGIVCISAGHNHERIKKRLQNLLNDDCIQHTSYLYDNPGTAEATQKLLSVAPPNLDRLAFTNSGSEANELALMAARHATGVSTVAHFEHSYHGGTSGTLNHCGHSSWRFDNQPTCSSVAVKVPYCYRCPFQKKPDSCGLECAKAIKETLSTATSGRIAAFIAEPILGVGGFITPKKEFFHELMEIVRTFKGKYISDEVQTGAGRCGGNFFYTQTLELDADVITLAKGLGNGAPIGACIGKSEIFSKMAQKVYFNTFAGDPYQAVQASETISIIQDEGLWDKAAKMGEYLLDALEQMKEELPIIGEVRGKGLLVGLELVKDRKTKEYASTETLLAMEYCKEEGVLIGKGGLKGNVLRIAPPLCITRDDLDWLIKAIRTSLSKICENM